jgi:hypothetical protein
MSPDVFKALERLLDHYEIRHRTRDLGKWRYIPTCDCVICTLSEERARGHAGFVLVDGPEVHHCASDAIVIDPSDVQCKPAVAHERGCLAVYNAPGDHRRCICGAVPGGTP